MQALLQPIQQFFVSSNYFMSTKHSHNYGIVHYSFSSVFFFLLLLQYIFELHC